MTCKRAHAYDVTHTQHAHSTHISRAFGGSRGQLNFVYITCLFACVMCVHMNMKPKTELYNYIELHLHNTQTHTKWVHQQYAQHNNRSALEPTTTDIRQLVSHTSHTHLGQTAPNRLVNRARFALNILVFVSTTNALVNNNIQLLSIIMICLT